MSFEIRKIIQKSRRDSKTALAELLSRKTPEGFKPPDGQEIVWENRESNVGRIYLGRFQKKTK